MSAKHIRLNLQLIAGNALSDSKGLEGDDKATNKETQITVFHYFKSLFKSVIMYYNHCNYEIHVLKYYLIYYVIVTI